MADIRLTQFQPKPVPVGSDIVYIGDSGALDREKKSTIDQIAQAITPVPVIPSFGEMFFNGNTTETVISDTVTPVKINATYVSGELSNFTHANGTLTSTGGLETFKITACLSGTLNLTSAKISVLIYKNGSPIAKSEKPQFWGPTTPAEHAITCQALEPLSATDTVEIYIRNHDNTNNITVTDCNVIIQSTASGTAASPAKYYGGMYFEGNFTVDTTFIAGATPAKILAPAYFPSVLNGFTHSLGVLTYTGLEPKNFVATLPVNARGGSPTTVRKYRIYIAVNQVALPETCMGFSSRNNTQEFKNPTANGIFTLNPGDEVEAYADNVIDTIPLRVEDLQFSINQVSS